MVRTRHRACGVEPDSRPGKGRWKSSAENVVDLRKSSVCSTGRLFRSDRSRREIACFEEDAANLAVGPGIEVPANDRVSLFADHAIDGFDELASLADSPMNRGRTVGAVPLEVGVGNQETVASDLEIEKLGKAMRGIRRPGWIF